MLAFDPDHIDDLLDAWDECPPLRWMVAAYLGVKPKDKPSKPSKNFAELLAMFPGGAIR